MRATFVRKHLPKANHSHFTCEDVSQFCQFCFWFIFNFIIDFHLFDADTGEKPYQCEQCLMKFRQKDGLKRHENAKHTNKPSNPYPCDVCGKVLQSKYSLKFHLRKHSARRNALKCELCDKIVGSERALIKHKWY